MSNINVFIEKLWTMPDPYPIQFPAASRTLLLGDIEYHLHCWGEDAAPLVIFLHGWGDSGLSFQFVVDALQGCCRVVAPDWRGFGRTQVEQSAFWFPDYLADLDALLERLSPNKPVRLVGHSMGANVAALYAGARAERVAQFVNIEGFGLPDSDPRDAPHRYRKWLQRRHAKHAFRDFSDFSALAEHLQSRFSGLTTERAEFVARCWGVQSTDQVKLRAHPAHRLPNPVLYRRQEAQACWRQITAEYLFVSGTRSEFASEDHIDAVLKHVPHAQHVAFPEAGHMLHFDVPDALAAELRRFLRL